MDGDILGILKEEIGQRRFKPVYTLCGDEDYLIERALALFKTKTIPPEVLAFNYTEFSGKQASATEIVQCARTLPMLSEFRLIIVADLEAFNSADWEELASYVRTPNKKSVMVLRGTCLDRKTKNFKLLKEETCLLDFGKVKDSALERWASDFFRHRGVRISTVGLRKLIDLAGSSLQTLSVEAEKLILCAGREKAIEDQYIDELIQGSRQHGIFELTNALARRDRVAALRLLQNLLDSGEYPGYINSMIAWQLRRVLIAKEMLARGKSVADIASRLNVRSGLEDFVRQVKAVSFESASRVYLRLAEVDDRMKSTNLDEKILLENLICSL